MSKEDLVLRVKRSEKLVATGFCTLPLAFAILCLAALFISVALEVIASDFGTKQLPAFTQFFAEMRMLWTLLAIALPAASIWITRKRQLKFSIPFSIVSGFLLLFVAVLVFWAACLPFFTIS